MLSTSTKKWLPDIIRLWHLSIENRSSRWKLIISHCRFNHSRLRNKSRRTWWWSLIRQLHRRRKVPLEEPWCLTKLDHPWLMIRLSSRTKSYSIRLWLPYPSETSLCKRNPRRKDDAVSHAEAIVVQALVQISPNLTPWASNQIKPRSQIGSSSLKRTRMG